MCCAGIPHLCAPHLQLSANLLAGFNGKVGSCATITSTSGGGGSSKNGKGVITWGEEHNDVLELAMKG